MARAATAGQTRKKKARAAPGPATRGRRKRDPAPAARARFLSPELAALIRSRLYQVAGLMLLIVAGMLAIALVTYNSSDPSMNVATDRPPANLLGVPGAWVADFLFQVIGLASLLIFGVLVAWGVRLLRGLHLGSFGWRLLLFPAALVFAVIALEAASPHSHWPASGPGGLVGNLLFGALIQISIATDAGWGALIVGGVALLLTVALILPVLGMTWSDWRAVGRALGLGALFRRKAKDAGAVSKPDPAPAPEKRTRKRKARAPQEPEPQPAPAPKPRARKAASRVETPKTPAPAAKAEDARQRKLDLRGGKFTFPGLDLLQDAPANQDTGLDEGSLEQNARYLETVLQDFGIKGKVLKVRPGPVVTLYELEPEPGVRASRVINLSDDIARSMSAISARVAVIPGRNVIGIELPNQNRETVYLRELLASRPFQQNKAGLPLALGKDIGGAPVVADLTKMPHLLIAGTTGAGKSVGINAMILSLLYRLSPDQCKLIMIDPKMLELSVYDDIPHLLTPVVTEPKKAVVALRWAVREMETRYKAMSKLGVRSIDGFNQRLKDAKKNGEVLTEKVQGEPGPDGRPTVEERPMDLTPIPFIVVVVDEMADLMLVAGKDIEAAVQRLAQMARAAGIHLIMATQRPSVDVITGTIKANFPTRISFQVTSKIDSRTILGEQGSEQLLGQGDMLYMAGGGRLSRVHGPFVSDGEVEGVAEHLRRQGEPTYIEEVTRDDDAAAGLLSGDDGGADADLYRQAIEIVLNEGKCSTSFIQRKLQIGYNRAARLVERMEEEGVVSPPDHRGKREILAGAA
jgi:S-DNA-T family DNA segregation ATPase FtsK/SpoIIIE